MPNRILKETICTSEEIDSLTTEQEVFFYRLMVVCDDYGLMDARTAIIKARCFPLKSYDSKRIQMLLDALNTVGLIRLYESNNRPYLHITNWEKHQSIRAKKSKYPQPQANDFNCKQTHANVPVIQSNPIQSESNPIQSRPAMKLPPCPVDKIVELYHDSLPELPKVVVMTSKRKDWIAARWKEMEPESEDEGLENFRNYFKMVRDSRFLMGRVEPINGHRRFSASLEWLVNQSNFAKVLEKQYHENR